MFVECRRTYSNRAGLETFTGASGSRRNRMSGPRVTHDVLECNAPRSARESLPFGSHPYRVRAWAVHRHRSRRRVTTAFTQGRRARNTGYLPRKSPSHRAALPVCQRNTVAHPPPPATSWQSPKLSDGGPPWARGVVLLAVASPRPTGRALALRIKGSANDQHRTGLPVVGARPRRSAASRGRTPSRWESRRRPADCQGRPPAPPCCHKNRESIGKLRLRAL